MVTAARLDTTALLLANADRSRMKVDVDNAVQGLLDELAQCAYEPYSTAAVIEALRAQASALRDVRVSRTATPLLARPIVRFKPRPTKVSVAPPTYLKKPPKKGRKPLPPLKPLADAAKYANDVVVESMSQILTAMSTQS